MDRSADVSSTPPSEFDRLMPAPPLYTSDELIPGWQDLRVCLYRLQPARVTLPAGQTLRVVVQLSPRSVRLERSVGGITRVAQPRLDAININPAHQAIDWQWDSLMEFVQIHLSPALLRRMEADMGIQASRLAMLERFNVHDALIAQLGHELADLLERRRPAADAPYLDMRARFLVTHLWKRYCCNEEGTPAKNRSPDFHQIVNFIHDNLDKDLRLEQLARMANLSNFYFIRRFKAAVGKTPHQYVLDCRVHLAKDLLRNSYLPIGEIGRRCGYSTQSHFTSAFRDAVGQSPRVYRQGGPAHGLLPH